MVLEQKKGKVPETLAHDVQVQAPTKQLGPEEVVLPRRILVAVDAESLGDDAIRAGLEIARVCGSDIDFVHAISAPMEGWTDAEDPRRVASGLDLQSYAQRSMLEHVRDLLSEMGRAPALAKHLRVVPGPSAKVILDLARTTGSDLIVLGALRRRPIFDFGSTARAVLNRAPCAVWVQPRPVAPIRRIVVGFDFSEESWTALATACALARRFGAEVRTLHCFDSTAALAGVSWGGFTTPTALDDFVRASDREFKSAMKSFAWPDIGHDEIFFEGPPAERILELSKASDLVVMGTHGRTGIAAAVLGSVAYSVLKNSTCPVMVVRKSDRQFAA